MLFCECSVGMYSADFQFRLLTFNIPFDITIEGCDIARRYARYRLHIT